MARVQNTLIGKSSGSVGGATFSTWKGINVLKSKAIVVANPQTNAQMVQREKMTQIVALFRLLDGLVNIGFKTLAIGKSEYNAFVGYNIKQIFSGSTPGTVAIDYTSLLLSKGTMGVTPIGTITATNGSPTVGVDWDDALVPLGSSPSDLAYAAIYNADTFEWGVSPSALRSAGTVNVVMPGNVSTADNLQVYLFFKSATSDEVSDSVNAQDVV